MIRTRNPRFCAVSLVELLVIISLIAMLTALVGGASRAGLEQAKIAKCTATLRNLTNAIHAYAMDHDGKFPRSLHSAAVHGEPGWSFSIAPYLGYEGSDDALKWREFFNRNFRCPEHRETNPAIFSYALNVYFELDPMNDSYPGSPMTWRTVTSVPRPTATVLLAETAPVFFGDHIMAHLWVTPQAVASSLATRHNGRLNFAFVDGSVRRLSPQETFGPAVNLWWPRSQN